MRIVTLSLILGVAVAAASGGMQGVDFNRNIASSADVLAPVVVVERGGCSTTDCHPGIKEHSVLHGPLQVDACDACHVSLNVEQHEFSLAYEREKLCVSCHEIPGHSEALHVHEPLVEGECQACHDPHGSEQYRALRSPDLAGLCLGCHGALTDGERLVHAPESKGDCGTCHSAHISPNADLLLRPIQGLCSACHVDTAESISSSFLVHPPAIDGCRLCHDPHATTEGPMLIADTVTLCTGCHEDVGHNMDSVSHPHAAMTADKACMNCHEPHAGDYGHLLREEAAGLCYQCHDKVVKREAGGVIPSIKAVLIERQTVHSPAGRGECTLCHQVHGSDRGRLLKEEHAGTYAAFADASSYALCFACHDRNLALDERTNAVTSFRNGDQNLHFVHLNRPKSRSCNICHDPHATDAQHLIRESFPFGPARWALEIGWASTETGGQCATGCHAPFGYDREQAVTNKRESGDDRGWRGIRPENQPKKDTRENQ